MLEGFGEGELGGEVYVLEWGCAGMEDIFNAV